MTKSNTTMTKKTDTTEQEQPQVDAEAAPTEQPATATTWPVTLTGKTAEEVSAKYNELKTANPDKHIAAGAMTRDAANGGVYGLRVDIV